MTYTARKAHIVRLHGKSLDASGAEVDEMDVWLDVWRADEIEVFLSSQRYIIRLKWGDRDGDDPSENRRKTTVKVIGPDEDPNDPQVWVPVDVVDSMLIKDSDTFLRYHWKNKRFNSEDPQSGTVLRDMTIMRVTHWDTNPDKERQWVSQEDYSRVEGTQDEDQYIEVEVPRRVATNEQAGEAGEEGGVFAKYRKRDENFLELMKPIPEGGPSTTNLPTKLDPFQQIINCQLGGTTRFIEAAEQDAFLVPTPSSMFTLSCWFYIDVDNYGARTDVSFLNINNAVNALNEVVASPSFFVGAIVGDDPDFPDNLILSVTGSPRPISEFYSFTGEENGNPDPSVTVASAYIPAALFGTSSAIRPRQWHHAMVAFDGRQATVVNGQAPSGTFISGPLSVLMLDGQTADPFIGSSLGLYAGRPPFRSVTLAAYDEGPSSNNITQDPRTVDLDLGWTYQWQCPPLSINFEGTTWSVGTTFGSGTGEKANIIAYLQFWPNKFIDPRTDIALFYKNGGAVPPAKAWEKFGKPELYLKGLPTSFAKNKGTLGGKFTPFGSIKSSSRKPPSA